MKKGYKIKDENVERFRQFLKKAKEEKKDIDEKNTVENKP